MRFLTNIQIEHAIAHHLDHLMPEKVISKKELKLSEALQMYIAEHIIAVSRLGSLVPAKFFDEPGEVGQACRKILSGESRFVTESTRIAERLFTVMGNNRTLSPGLLVVAQVRNLENSKKFIALLKMEAQPVFKEDRQTGPNGETFIELTIDPVALPAPGKHLQKCALIKMEHTPSEPEILLVDKQARDAAVAGFFHEHFLQAEYCRDSHFRTKKFVKEFVKWANKARQEHRMSPAQLDETVSAAREVLLKDKVSVPDFIQETIQNRGEQSDCLETLTKKHVDPKFQIARKAAERFCKVTNIKLDHASQLRMAQSAMLDKEFYSVEKDPDDQTLTVITIRTRKYLVG